MAFSVKNWRTGRKGGTPINEAAIEDLERRLSQYTDDQIAVVTGVDASTLISLMDHEADTTAVHGIADTAAIKTLKGAVNGVTAMGFVLPDATGVNGFQVKAPSAAWRKDLTYGFSQAFQFLREDYSAAPNGGSNIYPDKAVLARLSGLGGWGFTGGLHVATALRQDGDFSTTQAIWVQNFADMVGLVINLASSGTASPILVETSTGGQLFSVAANGQVGMLSNSNAVSAGFGFGRNFTNQKQLLALGTDLVGLIPGTAGDCVFHINDLARGFVFSTGALDGSSVAYLSIGPSGVFVGINMDMAGHKIVDMANGTAPADAVNRSQLDAVLAAAQPLATNLTAIAALTTAADKLTYWTGSGAAALADFTATARSLLDDTSISAMRTTLGLGSLAVKSTVDEADMTTGASGPAKGAFSAYRHAALTVAAAGTMLACDTEEFDVSNWFDTATGKYTPQVAGYYSFGASAVLSSVAQGKQVYCALFKNGALVRYGLLGPATNAVGGNCGTTGGWEAQANGSTDYFEVQILHTDTTGRALLVDTGNTFFGRLIGRS